MGQHNQHEDVQSDVNQSNVDATDRRFTPGPWEVFDKTDRYPGIEAEGLSIVCLGDEPGSLQGVQGDTHKEALANAHLIAAAPDLYEVVRRCLTASIIRVGTPLHVAAVAAMAKADGREVQS